MRFKSSAIVVDENRRYTPEALSALQGGNSDFKLIAIPSGTIGSSVPVIFQVEENGSLFLQTSSGITSITLTRGSTTINVATSSIIPVSRGDVINFTYTVASTNNPILMLSPS